MDGPGRDVEGEGSVKKVKFELGEIIQGDCLEVLEQLPKRSFQMCITSPPYWALRSYLKSDDPLKAKELGSERTPEEFVANLVKVFRRVHRVLRDDGILVLNLGDSYSGGGKGPGSEEYRRRAGKNTADARKDKIIWNGIGGKQLVGVPWRVAFALQADGWILRSDIPWLKRGPMPESVTDRPAKALEYVFMFAKQERYFFDMEAIKKKATGGTDLGILRGKGWLTEAADSSRVSAHSTTIKTRLEQGINSREGNPSGERNFRNADLWFQSIQQPHGLVGIGDELIGLDVTSEPLYQAHFAAYPCALVEPFIKAGTSLKGCCPDCGTPWRRKVEKKREATRPANDSKVMEVYNKRKITHDDKTRPSDKTTLGNRDPQRHCTETKTVGWEPGCDCGKEPIPCRVLDPFSGAATSLLVAQQLGRRFTGIELNDAYVELGRKRLTQRGELGGPRKEKRGGFKEKLI